jgi:hypothetical protein
MLSEKTIFAARTPSFLFNLDSIVFAQPISQVIPEIARRTSCFSVVERVALVGMFFSELQLVKVKQAIRSVHINF